MLKRLLSFLLVIFILNSAVVVFAGTKDELQLIEKVKSQVSKIGTGAKARVKVKLKDGTKIKGYISEANGERFVVIDEQTGKSTPIPYPQVSHLSKRAVGFIVVGALFATLIILLATSKD